MKPSPLNWNTLGPQPESPPPEGTEQRATVQFTSSQLGGSRWDPRNEARPGAPRGARPDEKRLRAAGYTLYGIAHLRVLNSLSERDPDPPLGQQRVGEGGFAVVCSGTFVYELRGRDVRVPAGPLMRSGRLDSRGVEKGQRRGAVAVLANGALRIARTGGGSGEVNSHTLQAAFGSPDNPVVDLCGGGALLIERGARITGADLNEVQRFESGAGGFQAPQLRTGLHLAIGICDGAAWLIVAHSHSGESIQTDLGNAGFGSLVLFDGGSGGYLRDASGTPYQGREYQGFGIHLRG